MTITLSYQPGNSISIDDTLLLWKTDRQDVRQLLNERLEIADSVIDISEYYNGDNSYNILQRRDIYINYKGKDNLFFLNYDNEDKLRDIEIHNGFEVCVNGVKFGFSMNIDKVAELLHNILGDKTQLSDGEYLFKSLKLIIARGKAMGGEGNALSCFYCSKDIAHLLEE